MVGMAGITEDEQPHTSLAGVARGATALWVDGTAKDFAAVFGSDTVSSCARSKEF